MAGNNNDSTFRERGAQMTRVETFADAAFAFAVTLLVVGGSDSIPLNFDEMLLALEQVPAFAASFANIAMFWYAHHRWSRRYGLDDTASVLLTLTLVFVVLIFVYPLKAIFSGAIEFFSAGYFESYFELNSIDDLRTMFVIFGAGFCSMSLIVCALYRHALRQSELLELSISERFDTVTDVQHWLIAIAVPAASILLALTLPDRLVVVAGVFYAVFGITAMAHGIYRQKKRPPQYSHI